MATLTWNGAVSNNWFDPANWSAGSVPTATDEVILDGASASAIVPDGQTAVFAQLVLRNGAVLHNQGSIQTTGNILLETAAELRLEGGTVAGGTLQQTGGVLTAPPGPSAEQNALIGVTLSGDPFAPGVIRLAMDDATSTSSPDRNIVDATAGGILTLTSSTGPFDLSQNILMTNLALGLVAPVSASDPRAANLVVAGSGLIAGSGTIFPDFATFAFGTSDLLNQGTIESRAVGSTILNISTNSFENAGTVRALESTLRIGGDFPLGDNHVFRNLSNGVLTGGFYDVVAGDTGTASIEVNGNSPDGTTHTLTTLAAQITLSGQGSDFLVNGVSIAGSLLEIAEGGQLNLFSKGFNAGPTFTVSGFLNLQGGGLFSGNEGPVSLTVNPTGFIGGYGDLYADIVNNGTIGAYGVPGNETLSIGGSITGTNVLFIAGDSILRLGGSVAGGIVTFEDLDGADGGLQILNASGFDATIAGFTNGDLIELTNAFGAASLTFADGELTVLNGADQELASLTLAGDYTGKIFILNADGDPNDGADITLVDLDPNNAAPDLVAPTSLVVVADDVVAVQGLSVTDADAVAEGEVLTVTVRSSTGTLAATAGTGTVTGIGTTTLLLRGTLAEVNASLGTITYTGASPGIEADSFALDTLSFFVTDGEGGSDGEDTGVTINQVPVTAPVLITPAEITINPGLPSPLRGLYIESSFAESTGQLLRLNLTSNDGIFLATNTFGAQVIGASTGALSLIGTIDQLNGFLSNTPWWQQPIPNPQNPVVQANIEAWTGAPNGYQSAPNVLNIVAETAGSAGNSDNRTPNDGGSTGDPHIHTFDGASVNLQAVGEFVLARSTDGGTFEAQIRLGQVGQSPVSTTTALALRISDQQVMIDPARAVPLLVDGVPLPIAPGTEVDLGEARISLNLAGRYVVSYDSGETVSAQVLLYGPPHLDVIVTLPADRAPSTVEGLAGNNDGNLANDLARGDGEPTSAPLSYDDLYGTGGYADRWRVTDQTSLFHYENGDSTATFTDLAFPGSVFRISDVPVEVLLELTEAARAAGLTDPGLIEDAVYDYLVTGDANFIQAALNAQEQGLDGNVPVNPAPPVAPSGVGVAAIPANLTEEAGATTTVTFKVYRIGAITGDLDVSYAVVAAGAGYAGADDFGGGLPSGTVTIPAGASSADVTLELENEFAGVAQRVQVALTGATGASGNVGILAPTAVATVANRDPVAGTPAEAGLVAIDAGLDLTSVGSSWVLDLGTFIQGTDAPAVRLALANIASLGANSISAIFVDDGTVTGFEFVVPATIAALAPGALRSFTIDADTSAIGSYSETITLDLSQSNSSGFSSDLPTLTLTVVANVVEGANAPPVATDDNGATNEDSAIQFAVATLLANDTDGDDDLLTLTAVSNAVGGTVSLSGGIVTFTPTANFSGPASFDYTISDGELTDTATVAIAVAPVNDEQTAPATNTVTTLEDTASVAIAIGASDVDGDTLSYAVKPGAEPTKGSVSFSNGSFVYTPLANANGADTFTILIDDGQGAISEQVVSVTITPVNDEETAPATNTVTTLEDTASTAIAIGASDVDGDTLSYAVKPGAEPTKGSVSFSNGSFVYTPLANANGSDTFTILIDDGLGAVFEQIVSVSITPVDDATSITGTSTGTVREDGTLVASGDLDAVDPDTGQTQFQIPTTLAGTYGTFSFNATTGAWSYTLDNASAAVQALSAADTRIETLNVTSLDGTATRQISVTVQGADEGGVIIAQPGQTTVNGTPGADSILIGRSNALVNAGGGNDTIAISPSNWFQFHAISGGGGSDTLDLSLTSAGATVALGNGAASSSQIGIVTLTSIENAIGSTGHDTIIGSSGANRIEGGEGNDRSTGGGGSDTFVFKPDFGSDRISDFDAVRNGGVESQDYIELQGFGIEAVNFASRVAILDAGNDTLVVVDGQEDQVIRLTGVRNHLSVTIDDFHFV